jgi:NADPH:quinone reductase-like Zn-dependent oxidoreductase
VKATLFSDHGGPEVLRYADAPDPSPGAGEVLVEVGAVTINHGPDTVVRDGNFRIQMPLPHVSGSDPAGTVVTVGEEVDESLVGLRVGVEPIIACGECDFCLAGAGENYCRNWRLLGVHRWGGRAEYVAVPAANLVPLPDAVSFEQAACLGMAYLSTYHGLVRKGDLGPGDTLLVLGAGGGVGVAAIQIAKDIGARVIAATREPWKEKRAREIGADVVVNCARPGWADAVREATDGRGVSMLFDNVGPNTWKESVPLLDRGGRFVCSGATTGFELTADVVALYRNHVSAFFYMCGARADLVELVRLVEEGRFEPVIDSRYPLSQAAAAEARMAASEQFGKIVLVPDSKLESGFPQTGKAPWIGGSAESEALSARS